MPPRALEQLGLDYESLKAIKPDIILVTNTAFGTAGPYAKKVGFDSVAQAMSGNMIMRRRAESAGEIVRSLRGLRHRRTLCFRHHGSDHAPERHRGRPGSPGRALLATALMTTSAIMSEEAVTGRGRVPTGNRGQVSAPSDLFRTKDGHIYVICAGQPMFERWAALMGDNHWTVEERFATDDGEPNMAKRSAPGCRNGARTRPQKKPWIFSKNTEFPSGRVQSSASPRRSAYQSKRNADGCRLSGHGETGADHSDSGETDENTG